MNLAEVRERLAFYKARQIQIEAAIKECEYILDLESKVEQQDAEIRIFTKLERERLMLQNKEFNTTVELSNRGTTVYSTYKGKNAT